METTARWLIVIPLCAGLAWMGHKSVEAANAASSILAASTEINAWGAMGLRPDKETWNSIHASLEPLASASRGNPDYYEVLGALHLVRTDDALLVNRGQNAFATALELRPSAPMAWARLGEARYLLGEPGVRLELPFQRARSLGPAEPGAQRLLADYGLAVWDEVTPAGRKPVELMVEAGMRRNPMEMLRISERRGRLAVACAHLPEPKRATDARLARLCPSREITP